jgi:hypothetical protein
VDLATCLCVVPTLDFFLASARFVTLRRAAVVYAFNSIASHSSVPERLQRRHESIGVPQPLRWRWRGSPMVFASTTKLTAGRVPQRSENRQAIGVPLLILRERQRGSPMVSKFRRTIILAPRGPAGLGTPWFPVSLPRWSAWSAAHLKPRRRGETCFRCQHETCFTPRSRPLQSRGVGVKRVSDASMKRVSLYSSVDTSSVTTTAGSPGP